MWKILGEDALYVEFADVWKRRVIEIASEGENGERFREIMEPREVLYLFNGTNGLHSFNVEFPEDTDPKDLQFLADEILKIAEDVDRPFISLAGGYQKCQVVFTSEKEPELIGANKTEGYGSGKIFMPILESLCKPGRANDGMF
jgi:hypothetical protein